MALSPFTRQLWEHDKVLINNQSRWNDVARRMTNERLMEITDLAARYKCRFLPLSDHPAIKPLCKRAESCFSTSIRVSVRHLIDSE